MRNLGPTVLLLFLFASAGMASASYLDVNLGTICYPPYSDCYFQNYINGPGSPAKGIAMFEIMTASGSRWSSTS